MAWQLIYTSAPRLLEAGRTGFGTVARHRAVSGMLSSSVERFSQFARLPGHDPRRIVHTYRLLTVGSGTYHVFSCLQDAGSDYTGRTNHIAHHLIAEAREIRALSGTGQTPADVLLAMKWRSTWSEGPRYLDPAEEVDLATLTAPPSRAWAAATGNPANARLLWIREALKGCYLIVPHEIHALELFRESLLAAPGQAWQTSFTTCLEPNDDMADFRWVAMPPASPMRGQVETSSRLVLDLTQPSRLPSPPELETPAPAPEAASPASEPEPEIPAREPQKERLRPLNAKPVPVSTMGDWSPDTRSSASKSGKNVIVISLLIAALLIVVVVGGLLWQYNRQQQQQRARDAYENAIAKTWKDYGLALDDTKKWLEEKSDLDEGAALLKSHADFFSSMKRLLKQPDAQVQLSLPADNKEDLKALMKLLEEWTEIHERPWASLLTGKAKATPAGMLEAYGKWQDSRNAKWKQLAGYLDLQAVPLPADDLLQPLKDKAKEMLRRAEPGRDTRADWEQVFALPDREKNRMDPDVQQWLKLWADLDGTGAVTAAAKAATDKSLPEWLRAKAVLLKEKNDKDKAGQMADKNKPDIDPKTKEPQKPAVAMEDADAPSAKNDVYIHLLQPGEDVAGKVSKLPVEADMQLYVGGAWDAHPLPDGKAEDKSRGLKKWMSVSLDDKKEILFGPKLTAKLTEVIVFSDDGKLISIPDDFRKSSDGVRIVARGKDAMRVLFDLRLIPGGKASASPVLANVIEAPLADAASAALRMPEGFLKRFHFLNPAYALRHDGSASEQKIYALNPAGDSSFEVLPPQTKTNTAPNLQAQDIRRQISELEAGIKNDDTALADLEGSKLATSVKEARRASCIKGRSEKELKLQTLRAKLLSMGEAPIPVRTYLPPGHYTLLLEQPDKIELCKLHVVPAAQPSNPKPSKP